MTTKTVTLTLTPIETHAVYSALKLLAAGHEDAIAKHQIGYAGPVVIATKKAIAKLELVLEDVEQLKGI